eukprot:6465237-Karenia_brevis.AAC.1
MQRDKAPPVFPDDKWTQTSTLARILINAIIEEAYHEKQDQGYEPIYANILRTCGNVFSSISRGTEGWILRLQRKGRQHTAQRH